MSADGRGGLACLGALAVARAGAFAAVANARSTASRAALRLAAMCSCTSRSMRSPRSHVVFALVMRAASHDRDHALNSTPERLPSDAQLPIDPGGHVAASVGMHSAELAQPMMQ